MFRLRYLAIEVFRCVKETNPAYLNEIFTAQDKPYNFRKSVILDQYEFKTIKFGYKSFRYYGSKVWNSLPADIQNSDDLYTFKRKLNVWCRSEKAASLEIE